MIVLVAAIVLAYFLAFELRAVCPLTRSWFAVCWVCWACRFTLAIALAALVA